MNPTPPAADELAPLPHQQHLLAKFATEQPRRSWWGWLISLLRWKK